MVESVRVLLTEILDYAGLFPPAELPLGEAVRAYREQRQSPHAWIQARFILPVGKLPELLAEQAPSERDALRLSLIASGGATRAAFLSALRREAEAAGALAGQRDRVRVEAFEAKLPPELASSGCVDSHVTFFEGMGSVLRTHELAAAPFWFEAAFEGTWRFTLPRTWEAMRAVRESASLPVGFKLRCGGVTAAAFPSPEDVAFVIAGCRDAGVPLKFTAGLHHPIRRHDASVAATMHGFLNVFVAGTLAHARAIDAEMVRRVLEEEDPRAFTFDPEGLAWREHRATVAEIADARQSAVTSFGSCSFEEPRADLEALRFL